MGRPLPDGDMMTLGTLDKKMMKHIRAHQVFTYKPKADRMVESYFTERGRGLVDKKAKKSS